VKFCIDFGHGGLDPGAIGPTGFTEAEAVKSIGKHIGRGLSEANHEVVYTRLNDVFVELEDRAKFANGENVDFFLSIHANAHETPGAHGFEVWTSPGQTGADPIATRIYESALATFRDIRGRPDFSDGDPDKEAKFKVLTQTRMPAVLIETAFISNPTEEKRLRDPGWRLRMGGAIVSGLWRN
jgi:N-acetylmuramoyl-L-alanine amidase